MRDLLELEQAVDLLLEHIKPPKMKEVLALPKALGRYLWEDIHATLTIPPFNRSPLDGYALHYEDTAGASANHPAVLPVTQAIYAGDAPKQPLLRGQAARVMTGAPLPEGTSCVIRQEDTDEDMQTVSLFAQLKDQQNICYRGEDMKKGDLLLRQGDKLGSASIGILAAQGIETVPVYARPSVGVLSTGSELATPGTPLSGGKIYDSNVYLFCARIEELGGIPTGIVAPDEPELLQERLEQLWQDNNLVVSTGGISVGLRDYMPAVGLRTGASPLFRGLSLKPGGPVTAMQKDDKLVLCLSGNPFAAAATFELLAACCIRALGGASQPRSWRMNGTLGTSFPKESKTRRFLRARIEKGKVFLPEKHASGVLGSMAHCNCLLDIPAGSGPMEVGTPVEVVML